MSRALSLPFAIFCYAIFFATFLYLIAFVGDLPVPKTVDSPPSALAPVAAGVVDVALIALFGFQHSIMARPGFKRAWTRIVPPPVERSVYVLCASIALLILFWFWQPIGGTRLGGPDDDAVAQVHPLCLVPGRFRNRARQHVPHQPFRAVRLAAGLVHLRGAEAEAPELRQPLFYRWVAHPLYAGFFLAFWATPAHELRSPAACPRPVDLHADRDPLRGARPHQSLRRRLSAISLAALACCCRGSDGGALETPPPAPPQLENQKPRLNRIAAPTSSGEFAMCPGSRR